MKNLNINEHSDAVFLDIVKAFDMVWHNGLLFKMYKSNFPIHIIKIIESSLANRSFTVKMDGEISNSKVIKVNLPQGSYLSPSLFKHFTNVIPVNANLKVSLFANDTMFISIHQNPKYASYQLQKQIDDATEYFKKFCL